MNRIFACTGLLLGLSLTVSSCKLLWRSIRYNKPGIKDYEMWAERPIRHEAAVHRFQDGLAVGLPALELWAQGKEFKPGMGPDEFFRKTGTVAFLMIRNDSLLYEYYAPKYNPEDRFNGFSMAKAYVAILTGIAVSEGYIESIEQPVGDFLPHFADSSLAKVKLRHLLQMTSGLKTSEFYLNPFSTTTHLYYGSDVDRQLNKLSSEYVPGSKWAYKNMNIQILSEVLRVATGRPVAEYLEEKIWSKIGMEADAGWSLHEGTDREKSFCCLNARARDFARFGSLLLRKGSWRGEQLIPEKWVQECSRLDTAEASRQSYQHCFYTSAEQQDYYLEGLLGQFTYICPETQTILVRLGNRINPKVRWYSMFKRLAGIKKKPKPVAISREKLKVFQGDWEFGLSNFGDSAMVGKKAKIRVKRRGLKVKSKVNRTWTATPSSEKAFFNLRYNRKLDFVFHSGKSEPVLRWYRNGNQWTLKKVD